MDVRTLYLQGKQEQLLEGQVQEWNGIMEDYLRKRRQRFVRMNQKEQAEHLISEVNRDQRQKLYSCASLGVAVRAGDICFIDFGADAYQCEIGFQHFGIVMKLFHGKAFVIPMSGNPSAYKQAYDPSANPKGKRHLMRIPSIEGLNKRSTLFLNDCKFINTARIIDIKAHIDPACALYGQIYQRMQEVIG